MYSLNPLSGKNNGGVFMRKLNVAVVIVLVMAILFAGTALGRAKTPKDALVMAANTGIFISLDPAICYEVLPAQVVSALYDKLVGFKNVNESLVIQPELAESWKISEDGMTFTFKLRDDAVFADGTEVLAEDVVWSYKRYLKLESTSVWLLESVGINKDNMDEKIVEVDEKTVALTFDAPYAENIVLGILDNSWGGVINKDLALQHEVDGDMAKGWLNDHSAGAGQYVLDRWERNTMVTMTANPNYYGDKPNLKRMMIRDVPEPANQRLLLEKGDIDVAWNLDPVMLEELKNVDGVQVVTTPGHSNEYLAMNASWGPLRDPKVRQAIKYAIEYDEIVDVIMAGYAIKTQGFIPKGYFGFVDENPFSQNIEKAKQLMAEAGYEDGFEVELLTNTTQRRKDEAAKVQADLKKIGIDAEVVIMQASQMYTKYRAQGHQMIIAGWGNDYADADNLAMAMASYAAGQLAYRCAWDDAYAIEAAEAGRFEKDPVKRQEIYTDLTHYWFENGPFAMFYQSVEFWGVREEVKNFYDSAFGYSMAFDWGGFAK
jgi:peptide/nickel transport system substrate-binding protein